MIRFKFGLKGIAIRNLDLYASATLEATLLPPPVPRPQWRALMDEMTTISLAVYRDTVRDTPDFLRYLRTVTPETELQMLPLGSRPARRRPEGGVESLRAIPWVFAWTQVRLMLPAWLGTGRALNAVMDSGREEVLREMERGWPYFHAVLDMLEMVLAKADAAIVAHYEACLAGDDAALRQLGAELRHRLQITVDALRRVNRGRALLENSPVLKRSISVRTPLYRAAAHAAGRDHAPAPPRSRGRQGAGPCPHGHHRRHRRGVAQHRLARAVRRPCGSGFSFVGRRSALWGGLQPDPQGASPAGSQ